MQQAELPEKKMGKVFCWGKKDCFVLFLRGVHGTKCYEIFLVSHELGFCISQNSYLGIFSNEVWNLFPMVFS